ncbi:hypothetical protein H181DRAFT_01335 [Streptomyces sp. WMMB 714]|uniref:hypothetical protein n=1 Tax=Streptomyces sp. WMMB 714 TaxID=1286822 RepID=UPI0005F7E58A|nr:hypothetical protein [Streptomyces sp. WMMB 714]SCK18918.1 hypothetical protein H181DRAFT_01335 [Streptomyces sp. WMMB 714]
MIEAKQLTGVEMDLAFGELALAALGGASGSLSEAVVTDLWQRLRSRFSGNEPTIAALETRDSDDQAALALLSEELRREAAADPEFRREMEDWLSLLGQPAGTTVNAVRDSQGLNAPGATFNSEVHMSFGRPEQAQ